MSGREYFRGDQQSGVTAPDLSKPCELHDHIVHARGKRTAHTSVSLSRQAISGFGECDYLLLRQKLVDDAHILIEHEALIVALKEIFKDGRREDKDKALRALKYSQNRKEGIITWNFDMSNITRKDLITWAYNQIQPYFRRV